MAYGEEFLIIQQAEEPGEFEVYSKQLRLNHVCHGGAAVKELCQTTIDKAQENIEVDPELGAEMSRVSAEIEKLREQRRQVKELEQKLWRDINELVSKQEELEEKARQATRTEYAELLQECEDELDFGIQVVTGETREAKMYKKVPISAAFSPGPSRDKHLGDFDRDLYVFMGFSRYPIPGAIDARAVYSMARKEMEKK